MKSRVKTIIAFAVILSLILVIEVWNGIDVFMCSPRDYTLAGANIHLYGESHGLADYYEKEAQVWETFYLKGNRDLFVELPYYTAEFLNLWMQADSDEILNQIYDDIEHTQSHVPAFLDFYKTIKEKCPETVFHGTDVGHQYNVTGKRYLEYLESEGLKDSENYRLAENCVEQGKHYYGMEATDPYREQMLVENFINAYKRIGEKEIMGIYGSYHTNLGYSDVMASKIKEQYPDNVECIFVSNLLQPGSYNFGVGYVGIVFLLMLFIPNIIWFKKQPEGYSEYAKKENKLLAVLEKAGQAGAVIILLIFTDFNFRSHFTSTGGLYVSYLDLYIFLALALMVLYEIYWIRYFKSKRTMQDFYSGIAGIPLAGATLPVMALLILGIGARNAALIAAAVILGIGHIGIHYNHYKESRKQ